MVLPLADATVQVLVNAMLKSNASREMLIDQFEGIWLRKRF
jgi:hypothetical protein